METPSTDLNSHELWCKVADFLRSGSKKVLETHISLIFFYEDRVYKLKKPVCFDFVDFRTVECRHSAAEQEVVLNRRLAANVYRELVPVTVDDAGGFSFQGVGKPIEWIVEMRRLPDDLLLDREIAEHRVNIARIKILADKLAAFYAKARRIYLPEFLLKARIKAQILDNRSELSKRQYRLDPTLIERVIGRQMQFLALSGDLLEQRVSQGFVVDGHGDLRPEHVCLESDPVVFDCLEFNQELREVDIADDLGFLAMECERLGAPWVTECVIDTYKKQSGDDWPEQLFDFYRAYRATVRAKVAVLMGVEARQLAEDYLYLADRILSKSTETIAILFRGLIGSGKSTLAKMVAEQLGAPLIQTDFVRRQIFGASTAPLAYGQGHYNDAGRTRVYQQTVSDAKDLVNSGRSVVIDGCFLDRQSVFFVMSALISAGVRPFVVHCVCPEEVILQRLAIREAETQSLSEARSAHYEVQRSLEQETPHELPGLKLNTNDQTLETSCEQVMHSLKHHFQVTALNLPAKASPYDLVVAEPCPAMGL